MPTRIMVREYHNCSTACNSERRLGLSAEKEDTRKHDGHRWIRVRTRDGRIVHIYARSYRARFSQDAVNDHLGGRTRRGRINAVALVICNEARVRARHTCPLRRTATRARREGGPVIR